MTAARYTLVTRSIIQIFLEVSREHFPLQPPHLSTLGSSTAEFSRFLLVFFLEICTA